MILPPPTPARAKEKALQSLQMDLEKEHGYLQVQLASLDDSCDPRYMEKRMLLSVRVDELERQMRMLKVRIR